MQKVSRPRPHPRTPRRRRGTLYAGSPPGARVRRRVLGTGALGTGGSAGRRYARRSRNGGTMTRLQLEIEAERPVTVVRFVGALDLAGAANVWNVLVKLLADQPDAFVIDLAAVAVDDAQVLLMFGALARRAGVWPGVPVILVAPDPAV